MTTLNQADLDRVAGMSSREAAETLGVGKSTVNKYREQARMNGGVLPGTPVVEMPKGNKDYNVLFIDIETKPAVVLAFSLFKPVFSPVNVIADPEIMCFTYNWSGQKVNFIGQDEYSYVEVLRALHRLLDTADIVVHYNGKKFDVPWIEGELNSVAELPPPAPFKQVDLYQAIRRRSNFISGKLEYVAPRFLDDFKVTNSGMSLWKGCMDGDREAWKIMRTYAIQDTALLEPLHDRVLGWIANYPNTNMFVDDGVLACPRCQSQNYQRRGYDRTGASKYQRYQCQDCGGWFSDSTRIAPLVRARVL